MPRTHLFFETAAIHESDRRFATKYSFSVLQEYIITLSDKMDIKGRRGSLPIGVPGLVCRHCRGISTRNSNIKQDKLKQDQRSTNLLGYGRSGRYFPTSKKTLAGSTKTLHALYSHLIGCQKCLEMKKDILDVQKRTHEQERRNMMQGSQLRFFECIWDRMHSNSAGGYSSNPFQEEQYRES
jgi:hypothetical protein